MCFQRSSEGIEGVSWSPKPGWKVVPQSRTSSWETPDVVPARNITSNCSGTITKIHKTNSVLVSESCFIQTLTEKCHVHLYNLLLSLTCHQLDCSDEILLHQNLKHKFAANIHIQNVKHYAYLKTYIQASIKENLQYISINKYT